MKPVRALLLILVVVALAFLPCLANDLVDWDDDVLITDNPYVHALSWANLRTIVSQPLTNAYHPLTILVWALGYRLWGTMPLGYHVLSLVLHLVTTALVFRWVRNREESVPAAAAAALWFAVHPMRVESVAWASDLKDLLAGMFFMAALVAYERSQRESWGRWYAASLGLFLLAGVSKSTAIMFPAVVVLDDFLRRRPLDRFSLLGKLPFFALSGLLALTAVIARSRFEAGIGKELLLEPYSAAYRLNLVGHRLVFYFLQRSLVPTRGIGTLYPDFAGVNYVHGIVAWGAVLAVLVAAVLYSMRQTRKVAFGVGFFVVTLAPALAAVSYGYTADRFSYVPAIGLSYLVGVAVAAGDRATAGRQQLRGVIAAAGIAAIAVLAALTWRQCGVWQDSVSLWSDAIARYRNQPTSVNLGVALTNRGRSWLARGEFRRALRDLDEALPIAPDRHRTLYARAVALAALGERENAIRDLREVLALAPDHAGAREFLETLSSPDRP